jgi:hypothetical protein
LLGWGGQGGTPHCDCGRDDENTGQWKEFRFGVYRREEFDFERERGRAFHWRAGKGDWALDNGAYLT